MNAIYFLHIPKTAGTSITALLQQEYGARLCPYRLWDQIALIEANDLATYDAFAGHFGMTFVDYIQRPLKIFTILRDPLDQTISHFLHIKRDPNHRYFNVAQDMDLRAFLLHPITRSHVNNFQARQLANQALSATDSIDRIGPTTFSKHFHAATWEAASYFRSESEIRLRALKALSTLDYVAVTEQIDECVAELARLFGLSKNAIGRENAASNRDLASNLDEGLISLIKSLTEIDQELYGLAKANICRRGTMQKSA